MLQELPISTLREGRTLAPDWLVWCCSLTLADVKAIARLVNDRRVADNLRRVPHPYTRQDAVDFVSAAAITERDTVS